MIVQFETSSVTIARAIGAKHYGADMAVKHITTDSRLLDDKSLFVPIAGQKFDGHDFIEEVCKSGKCSSVLTHKHTDVAIAERYGVSAIVCDDTLHAYMDIALWHRKNFDIPTIGITGTNGKTTTKEMIANVLESQGRVLKTEKNYNNEIGVPYTLLHLNKEHVFAVIEMGMNHIGEIHRLSLAAAPDVAVITNIGEGHLEFVGSTMNVAHAKAEILDGMNKGICIINNETKHKDIVINKANDKKINVITFGLTGDIRPATFAVYADKTVVQYDGIDFVVYAYGFHNVYAMLATIAVAKILGIPLNHVKESLECFKPVSMRSALHNGRCIIIDDSYNANPLSMEYAFASASMVFPHKRKIAVLSDMKELGNVSKELHYEIGAKLAHSGFAYLFIWGNDARFYADGAIATGFERSQVYIYDDKEELIPALRQFIQADDVVLVKGSRSMKMEEVVKALE